MPVAGSGRPAHRPRDWWGASTLAKIATSVTGEEDRDRDDREPCDRSVAKRQASVSDADVDRLLSVVRRNRSSVALLARSARSHI